MKKSEIVEFLKDHQSYRHWPIAWNIKVGRFNDTGRVGHFSPDPAYDDRWQKYLEQDDYLFWTVCEDLLSGLCWEDKPYEFFDGVKGLDGFSDYEMSTAGRSGGWLVLDRFEDMWGLERVGLNDMPYQQLRRLYRFIQEIDQYVSERHQHLATALAIVRQEKEIEWKKDDAEKQALAEAPVGPYYVPYGGSDEPGRI